MRKLFKYDIVTLIEFVESKPRLWDKNFRHIFETSRTKKQPHTPK